MARRNLSLLCAVAVLAAASLASAQNAGSNTSGPTKNDLRLRLAEPTAGQTITGSTIRVTVDYNRTVFGQGQGTKFGEPNYPQPRFDVYIDNKLAQTLKGGESNVATLTDVSPGAHTVAVVAKNLSNEVIDRQEVKVTNVAGTSSTETGTTSGSMATSGSTAPAPAPESSTYSSGATAPPPPPERPATAESPAPSSGSTASTMPRTASRAPLAAAFGLALVAAGLLIFRKAR
jgi:hypothetical protein